LGCFLFDGIFTLLKFYSFFVVGIVWDIVLNNLLTIMDVARYAMGTRCYMFEVHHVGTFNRQCRVNYIGGNVSNYPNPYYGNNLTFSDIEDVCSTYGYRSRDLIYYSLPGVSLDHGLRLISDDFSVNEMVAKHLDHDLLVLYIVTYGVTDDVVDEDE
jgi:hypothetical protein